jgi:REP element-mobilizing transposase RayT
MASSRRYEVDYFTATILEWKFLLSNDLYKDIIVGSIRHLVMEKRITMHAFVVMNNHMHFLWHTLHPNKKEDVQRDLLKFTAQMMIKDLRNNNTVLLQEFYVGAKDRKYQIWERNPLTVPIWSEQVLKQKLDYIHNNPVKAGLCARAEDYKYSTAAFYGGGEDAFGFITPMFL